MGRADTSEPARPVGGGLLRGVHSRCVAPLEQVVAVAGQRWRIETCFEQAKSECGLDEYECRRWEAWHRHVTLALLALAFLSVVGAAQKGATVPTPKS